MIAANFFDLLAVSRSQRVCIVNFDLYRIDCHLFQILCAVVAAYHAQPLHFNGAKMSMPDDVHSTHCFCEDDCICSIFVELFK
jgi:hypothetical protein